MVAATLRQMADIVLPPPVSMLPATWGWVLLAVVVALVLVLALWIWLRRRARNLYRREAIAELASLEASIGDPAGRRIVVTMLPALIKRTALAVWPREEVAALNGHEWSAFLKAHAGKAEIDEGSYQFFEETEYRSIDGASLDEAAVRHVISVTRKWIEAHDVRA
jgi:HAMP domain-containing protein